MLAKLRNSFIAGLLVILPVILTIFIIRYLVETLNNIVLEPMVKFFRPYLPGPYFVYLAKGGAFLVVVFLVILVGLAMRFFLTRKLFVWAEMVLLKVPLMNRIYIGVKEISHAFLGQSQKFFKRVVLIEYPRKGVYSVGFVTSDARGELQIQAEKKMLTLFVPTTPNPTSGVMLVVPEEDVQPLEMSVEQGLKLVISGGVVVPNKQGCQGGQGSQGMKKSP